MGRKGKNLNYDLQMRISKMLAAGIGTSKHADKQRLGTTNGDPNKLYSVKTAETYRQAASEFSSWIREVHGVNRYSDVQDQHLREYLLTRQGDEKSAWTVSRDMAALNKLFHEAKLTKESVGLKERSISNVTRSRKAEHYTKQQLEANRDQILLSESFGLRRRTVLDLQKSDFYKLDQRLYVAVMDKGGRYRYIECLKDNEKAVFSAVGRVSERTEHMTLPEWKQSHEIESHAKLFESYDKHIDNHGLRAQYAKQKLAELVAGGKDLKDAKLALTRNLGHNRVSVLAHYLK